MTSQYLMHCVLRKTLCTTSSVSERGDMDSENQCGDPKHRITLCEINRYQWVYNNQWVYNKRTFSMLFSCNMLLE